MQFPDVVLDRLVRSAEDAGLAALVINRSAAGVVGDGERDHTGDEFEKYYYNEIFRGCF